MSYIILTAAAGALCWVALTLFQNLAKKKTDPLPDKDGLKLKWKPSLAYRKTKGDDTAASTLIRYDEYSSSLTERCICIVIGSLVLGIIGYIFYKNAIAAMVLGCGGLYSPVIWRKQMIRKRQAQLQLQFKQALSSLSSALGAGKSVESAFKEALTDLRLLYPDSNAFIVKELETVNRRIENGETVEAALKDWSDRAKVEDIQQFADVFVTCKRTGGNLVQVIRRTAAIIQEKLDIQQDIQVMMAQKRFESKVLTFAPLVVIALLNFSSPDYMEPLYQGTGLLIMTTALLILIGCYAITKWIMDVKV